MAQVWRNKNPVRWTILGITILTIASFLLLMGLLDSIIKQDVRTAMTFLLPISMIGLGFPLANAVNGGFRIDKSFSEATSNRLLFMMTLSAGAIMMINLTRTAGEQLGALNTVALSGSIVNTPQFAVIMGVAEEILFRVFLTKYLSNIGGVGAAVFASATMFMAYHFWRYGDFLPLLLVTFGSGMVLSWAFLQSGNPSSVILPHALINYMSFLGPIMIMVSVTLIATTFLILRARSQRRRSLR